MFIFYPSLLGIALALNLIIDALVQYLAFQIIHLKFKWSVWIRLLWQIWFYGLIADFIGSLFLTLLMTEGNALPSHLFDPYVIYTSPSSVALFALAIVLSAVFIYFLDLRLFKRSLPLRQARRIALSFAIFTAPYTFLIPTTWIIH